MLTEEIKTALDSMIDGVDAFKTDYNRQLSAMAEHLAKLEAKIGRPGSGGALSIGNGEMSAEVKSLNSYVRGDFKALTVGSDPAAGYLVPATLQTSLISKEYDPPTLLGLVRLEQWDGAGSEWIEPRKRALLTARRRGSETEAAQDTGATAPVGLLTVPAGEAEAQVEFSQKLLDDTAFDLSAMTVGDMNAAFDRQIDAEIVSGTGTGNQATGFLSGTPVTTDDTTRDWGQLQYVPSTAATSVTADSLRDLYWTLRAPYRGGASWVMSSSSGNSVDKLKDGEGSYLWRNSSTAGVPPTLLGLPVYFDENMPSIAAGNFPIALANWPLAYIAVRKFQMRLLRDPFTAKPDLILYGYRRQGGAVANSEALKVLKVSVS